MLPMRPRASLRCAVIFAFRASTARGTSVLRGALVAGLFFGLACVGFVSLGLRRRVRWRSRGIGGPFLIDSVIRAAVFKQGDLLATGADGHYVWSPIQKVRRRPRLARIDLSESSSVQQPASLSICPVCSRRFQDKASVRHRLIMKELPAFRGGSHQDLHHRGPAAVVRFRAGFAVAWAHREEVG